VASKKELCEDGGLAQDQQRFQHFWDVHESIPKALATCKYDLSLPHLKMYQMVHDIKGLGKIQSLE